jgi:hypothetical protein
MNVAAQNGQSSSFNSTASFKNFCNYLSPCKQCQLDDEKIRKRQIDEKNEFIRLREKSTDLLTCKSYAISAIWFKQWEQFVQFQYCPLKHQIPGKINNFSICIHPKQQQENTNNNNNNNSNKKNKAKNKNITYQLNKSKILFVNC